MRLSDCAYRRDRCAADDAKSLSARLSDEAFALLNSVSGNSDTPSRLLGPVGVLAADSQKLSGAIPSGDRRGAGVAMAAVKSDAADVDKAAGTGGQDAAKWTAIKHDFDSLSTMVPAARAPAADRPRIGGFRPIGRVAVEGAGSALRHLRRG